ncbi:MAG: TIGR03013 family PEP-CTERM/XrtA system glycosyltransferase [Burkholderiales bacterium]|nr:TIGR03013 family PEP-CTERM/XrtA system glycosyltransferase [Burkholderiales bacterium]MDE1925707.1 TIGR03013 family PEP-CTERM/XrtA system glycosyltransferase [Burkholderiales bacterium]MDE2147305.1 TIGR03013 family PEP-CTERM/XrtA system glycosyltransferase [Burkholderiales bacterium]MDE2504186.1 TIGR03013 family PEP-CTERM/XrtA system glycosyltransferase [Burkholderiales bacterium]
MIRSVSHFVRRTGLGSALVDALVVMAAVIAAVLLRSGRIDDLVPVAGTRGFSLAAGIFFINTASGFYESSGHRRTLRQMLLRSAVALALALPLTYLVLSLMPGGIGQHMSVSIAAMIGVAAVIVHRGYEAASSAARAGARSRVLVFGSGEAARLVGNTIRSADPNVEIVGYFAGPNEKESAVPGELLLPSTLSLLETARQRQVDEIVVALTERRAGSMPLRELLDCKLQGIKVYDINSHFEKRLGQIRIDYVYAGWLIFGDGFNQGLARTAVKRLFDIVCASLLILLSSPLMLLAAIAIRLESRGSVIYRQERVGMSGENFVVIKFRSMRIDAEKDGKPRWATAGDNRITRVGRIIRKTRIDELPQLFSVLRGEMSLVGPRPERPFFVDQLTQEIPFYSVRHSVKPGVTGWAQVRYQYGASIEDSQEKLQYDLYYVKNHTLLFDLRILWQTVSVVLTGKGAH